MEGYKTWRCFGATTRAKERCLPQQKNQLVDPTFDFAKRIMVNYWRLTFFSFAITFKELPNSKIWKQTIQTVGVALSTVLSRLKATDLIFFKNYIV